MKAVVTQIDKNNAIILKEDGTFACVPDQNYKAGQEIYMAADRKYSFVRFAKVAAAAAACLLILSSGAVYAYNTAQSYVSIDMGSSVELEVNVFNRVISANGANENGVAVLEKMEIRHKSMEEAVELILSQASIDGYLCSDKEKTVVIGIHCTNAKTEKKVMESARLQIELFLTDLKISTSVSISSVDAETIKNARDASITAGKLVLIEHYLEENDDNSKTVDELIDMSTDELAKNVNAEEKDKSNSDNKKEEQKNKDSKRAPLKTLGKKSHLPKNNKDKKADDGTWEYEDAETASEN